MSNEFGPEGSDELREIRTAEIEDRELGLPRQVLGTTTREIVDDENRVSRFDQSIDNVRTDESGAAGD
jgi:hypothetical protein